MGTGSSSSGPHIDDVPVAKKGSIKGSYPLLEDGSFQVDNYNFKKK